MKTPENFIQTDRLNNNVESSTEDINYIDKRSWIDREYIGFKFYEKKISNRSETPKVLDCPPFTEESLQDKYSNFVNLDLPRELLSINEEIEDSRYILELEDDWDGANSAKIDPIIYNQAINVLVKYSYALFKEYKLVIQPPEINPGADGSIDLSWRTELARLLINIKMINGNPIAYFYRDHYNNKQLNKGELSLDIFDESFFTWMKYLK